MVAAFKADADVWIHKPVTKHGISFCFSNFALLCTHTQTHRGWNCPEAQARTYKICGIVLFNVPYIKPRRANVLLITLTVI